MFFTDPLLYLPKCPLAFYRPTILPTKMPPCSILTSYYVTDQNAALLFTDPVFTYQNAPCFLPTHYFTDQNAPLFFTDPLFYLPKCSLVFYRPTTLPTKMLPCSLPTHYFTDQNAPLFFTNPLFYRPKCPIVFYRPTALPTKMLPCSLQTHYFTYQNATLCYTVRQYRHRAMSHALIKMLLM